MKLKIFLLFILISNCVIAGSLRKELKKRINEKHQKEYRFHILTGSYIFSEEDSVLIGLPKVVMDGCDSLVHFCMANKKEVIPLLFELLKTPKYDWVANLLLFHITEHSAFGMNNYMPNNIKKWRTESKIFDIAEWSKYINERV